jgi:hypothetical protein
MIRSLPYDEPDQDLLDKNLFESKKIAENQKLLREYASG